jgi:hypothetical protein
MQAPPAVENRENFFKVVGQFLAKHLGARFEP